jgi:hypothetical protein
LFDVKIKGLGNALVGGSESDAKTRNERIFSTLYPRAPH